MACIMNAANEEAVAAYMKDETGFYGITDIVADCMAGVDFVERPTLDDIYATNEIADDIYATNEIARRKAREIILRRL